MSLAIPRGLKAGFRRIPYAKLTRASGLLPLNDYR
nr:MAG TPA: hypothetical protein [Caudoviricetes sp.]